MVYGGPDPNNPGWNIYSLNWDLIAGCGTTDIGQITLESWDSQNAEWTPGAALDLRLDCTPCETEI